MKKTKTTNTVQHCLIGAMGLSLSHTTAFVNIISGHTYTVKQITSEYYHINSFDLTNSLKKSRGPPWTHRSCFENYCPTRPLSHRTCKFPKKFYPSSSVLPLNLYELVAQHLHFIIYSSLYHLSLLKLIAPLGQKPSLIYL